LAVVALLGQVVLVLGSLTELTQLGLVRPQLAEAYLLDTETELAQLVVLAGLAVVVVLSILLVM
jgi:hypothetical protein